jgi:hypothetical protein
VNKIAYARAGDPAATGGRRLPGIGTSTTRLPPLPANCRRLSFEGCRLCVVIRRPDTPAWLAAFANDLYGGQCARCKVTRPLEVAHLSNWPEVKEYVASTPGADSPLVLQPEEAYWLFHQPVNVVLLCCNCHCLFDGAAYGDVTLADIVAARDAVLGTERAAAVVRDYFCRGYTVKFHLRTGHRSFMPRGRWADDSRRGPRTGCDASVSNVDDSGCSR